ncbi:hypothetical protein C5142_22780 [Rhodococcus sp. BGS-1C]|nr:hypothetical protein [Rhodococcus sp. KRD197]
MTLASLSSASSTISSKRSSLADFRLRSVGYAAWRIAMKFPDCTASWYRAVSSECGCTQSHAIHGGENCQELCLASPLLLRVQSQSFAGSDARAVCDGLVVDRLSRLRTDTRHGRDLAR